MTGGSTQRLSSTSLEADWDDETVSHRHQNDDSVRYAKHLKLIMFATFLPEGLSLFVGDFRMPLVRILILLFSLIATMRYFKTSSSSLLVPSDVFALVTGLWMMAAATATNGIDVGLKQGGATAVEFTGTYFVFRRLLGPLDSSVEVVRFGCKVIIGVAILASLDPLTKHLFTQDVVGQLTGYLKPYDLSAESFTRNGRVRAMGPLEHSILFGTACAWFGTLALLTFRFSRFAIVVAVVALIGILLSQSKGPLLAYAIGFGLTVFYLNMTRFEARWKTVAVGLALMLLIVIIGSSNPVVTLLQFGGLDPEAGWYREAIWATAGPLVLGSPVFGIGVMDDWGWQASNVLVGPTVDALWLRAAMMFGIPGSALIFLTLVSAFWLGPVDKAPVLSEAERRLSVALGIVVATSIFLGFTVHFWGACWILLSMFPAMRANLAEAAATRLNHPNNDYASD